MFDIKGKHGTARVFTDVCDDSTVSQLRSLMDQACVEGSSIRIMPDCHAGKGCVIGTTMTLTDSIMPSLVGVDIGCGMHVVKLKEKRIDFQKLDSVIRKYVPSGFGIHDVQVAESHAYHILANVNVDRAMRSLGTLGGGNHFIEVDKGEDGSLYLIVHTGSRHLGLEVCDYYMSEGHTVLNEEHNGGSFSGLSKDIILKLKAEGRSKEIGSELAKLKERLKANGTPVPYELTYVKGNLLRDYLHDMGLTQEHARINRETIVKRILKYAKLHAVDEFETIHNYIDVNSMILRKGAVSAKSGEKLLIPLNMRDGSLICLGKGNAEWNYSAPHGAGRLMSRSKARESISMSEFKSSMQGIFTTCVDRSTIDESPMAYKSMNDIIDNIGDTVDIVERIVPVYNFKAGEE